MRSLLSGHLEDCSTPQYFCFSIRCEVCGEYWYSSAVFLFPKRPRCPSTEKNKELYEVLLPAGEGAGSLQAASREARERFSQCPICRRLVCDACFLICDEMDLCRECAARMKEPGEPVAP